jgi:predicted nucleic acid-binding protein
MTVLLDLNVILDVVQRREPHYTDSARLLSAAARGQIEGQLPGHAITTIYYLVARYAARERAEMTVDWMLDQFDVRASTAADFRRARALPMTDFEDAVVAALAERMNCDHVVTRNTSDFENAPVSVRTPRAILRTL